jgi:hypothetical protein
VIRRTLRPLLEATALSLLLTALWLAWGQAAYEAFFAEAARPLLRALGVHALPDSPARRLGGILLGIPLLFLGHVGLVAVEAHSHAARRPGADAFSTLLPAALFADALPFVLWALFAADVLAGLLRGRGGRGAAP